MTRSDSSISNEEGTEMLKTLCLGSIGVFWALKYRDGFTTGLVIVIGLLIARDVLFGGIHGIIQGMAYLIPPLGFLYLFALRMAIVRKEEFIEWMNNNGLLRDLS